MTLMRSWMYRGTSSLSSSRVLVGYRRGRGMVFENRPPLFANLPKDLHVCARMSRFSASCRSAWGQSATLDGFAYDGTEWVSMKYC